MQPVPANRDAEAKSKHEQQLQSKDEEARVCMLVGWDKYIVMHCCVLHCLNCIIHIKCTHSTCVLIDVHNPHACAVAILVHVLYACSIMEVKNKMHC